MSGTAERRGRAEMELASMVHQGLSEDFFPQKAIEKLGKRAWILDYARKGTVGAEFGVFRGHFAEVIATTLKPKKLYLVDSWTKNGETFGWGENSPYTNYGQLTTKAAMSDTRQRMARFSGSTDVQICEDYLDSFCRNLDEKLDWAYLDTSHTYRDTLRELGEISTVIAADGVIMGDDWNASYKSLHWGVRPAVIEFLRISEFELLAAGPHGQYCIKRGAKYGRREKDGTEISGKIHRMLRVAGRAFLSWGAR